MYLSDQCKQLLSGLSSNSFLKLIMKYNNNNNNNNNNNTDTFKDTLVKQYKHDMDQLIPTTSTTASTSYSSSSGNNNRSSPNKSNLLTCNSNNSINNNSSNSFVKSSSNSFYKNDSFSSSIFGDFNNNNNNNNNKDNNNNNNNNNSSSSSSNNNYVVICINTLNEDKNTIESNIINSNNNNDDNINSSSIINTIINKKDIIRQLSSHYIIEKIKYEHSHTYRHKMLSIDFLEKYLFLLDDFSYRDVLKLIVDYRSSLTSSVATNMTSSIAFNNSNSYLNKVILLCQQILYSHLVNSQCPWNSSEGMTALLSSLSSSSSSSSSSFFIIFIIVVIILYLDRSLSYSSSYHLLFHLSSSSLLSSMSILFMNIIIIIITMILFIDVNFILLHDDTLTVIDQLLHDRIDRCSDLVNEQLINELIGDEVFQLQSEYVIDRYVNVDECNDDDKDDDEEDDEDEEDVIVIHVNDDFDDYYNADGDDSDRIDNIVYNSTHSSKHHNNDSDNEDNNNNNNMMIVDENSNFSNEKNDHNLFDQSLNQPINKLYDDNMMIDSYRNEYYNDDNSMMMITIRDVDVYYSDDITNRIDYHGDDRHIEGNSSNKDSYDEYDNDKSNVNNDVNNTDNSNNIITLSEIDGDVTIATEVEQITQYNILSSSQSIKSESDAKFNSDLLQLYQTSSPLVASLTIQPLSETNSYPSASDDEALINYDVYVDDGHEEGYFQSPDEMPSRSISRSNSMSRSPSNNLLLNHHHPYQNDDDDGGLDGNYHHHDYHQHQHHNAIDMNELFSNYLQNLSIDQCLQNVDRLIKICIIHRRTLFESLVDDMPMNVLTMLFYKNIHHMENNDDNNYNFNDEDNEDYYDDYNQDIMNNNNNYRGFNINKIRDLVDNIIKYDDRDKNDKNHGEKDDTDENFVVDNEDDDDKVDADKNDNNNIVVIESNNVKEDYGDTLEKLIDLTQSISQLSLSILSNK
jgi:hypothetical protein